MSKPKCVYITDRERVVEAPGEVVLDLVQRLKDLLNQAESGHLRGLAYARVLSDGRFDRSWCTDSSSATNGKMHAAVAKLFKDY